MTYPLKTRLKVRVFGMAKLDVRQPENFTAPTQFYLARCKIHGYYEDYLHGHDGYVYCKKCAMDAATT